MNTSEFPSQHLLSSVSLVATGVVLIGLADMPYGYYTLLRFVLCGSAILLLLASLESANSIIIWIFGATAVLYNPIVPIHLGDKSIWVVLNLVTIFGFWAVYFVARRQPSPRAASQEQQLGDRSKRNQSHLTKESVEQELSADFDSVSESAGFPSEIAYEANDVLDQIENEAERYHQQINAQVDNSFRFLTDNFQESNRSKYSKETLAVFTTHLAALVGLSRAFPNIHSSVSNGLTRTLSFRTPNTAPDVKPPPGTFVSYCSLEETYMHNQKKVFVQRGAAPLVNDLLKELGSEAGKHEMLMEHVEKSAKECIKTFLPHLAQD